MKLKILFSLLGLLVLSACGGQSAEIKLPEQPILEQPPRLTVETDAGLVRLQYGTASWIFTDGNGQSSGFEADAVHPLDEQAALPVLQPGAGTASIVFAEAEPDEILVRRWDMDSRGKLETLPEEVPVENGTFSLGKGESIYEVIGRWEKADRYGGSAYYAFCTRDLGIHLTAEDVTAAGLTLVCTQSGGDPTGELNTGSWYALQHMGKNGWENVPYSDKLPNETEIAWTAEAWCIPLEDTVQWPLSWDFLYGTLQPGTYRILKEVMDFRGTGDFDKGLCFAQFTIPEQ